MAFKGTLKRRQQLLDKRNVKRPKLNGGINHKTIELGTVSNERMQEIRQARAGIIQTEQMRSKVRKILPATNKELSQKNRRTPLIKRTQTKEKARRVKQMERINGL